MNMFHLHRLLIETWVMPAVRENHSAVKPTYSFNHCIKLETTISIEWLHFLSSVAKYHCYVVMTPQTKAFVVEGVWTQCFLIKSMLVLILMQHLIWFSFCCPSKINHRIMNVEVMIIIMMMMMMIIIIHLRVLLNMCALVCLYSPVPLKSLCWIHNHNKLVRQHSKLFVLC